MKIINQRLKELRNEKGLTQQAVADILKIDRSNYSKYERGKLEVSIDLAVKVANFYEVSMDYLSGRTDY